MEAERKRVANELRSEGSAEAEKFALMPTSNVKSLLPRPIVKPQKIKGEGDAKATATYAQAFQPES